MGLFGNMGSTKSSSSATESSTVSGDQKQAVQTGDALNVGSGLKSTSAVQGGMIATGKARITISNDLSAGVAHDSIQGVADVARSALNASAAQSGVLAQLAQNQNAGVLSAVTGRDIGSSAQWLTPVIIGAVVLGALFFMARK